MKILTLLLYSMIALFITNNTCNGNTHDRPKLVCDEPHYNFGKADSSKIIEHTFILMNRGKENLKISRIRSYCDSCTNLTLSKKLIPPGSVTELKTTFSLQGRSRNIHKPILVESNDPNTPNLQLLIEGTVIESIRVVPSRISFGTITDDSIVDKIIDISNITLNSDFRILKVTCDQPYFVTTVKPIKEGKKYQLQITTKSPLPQGIVKGKVHILTDSNECPIIKMPISLNVAGELVVLPDEILLVDNVIATRYVVVMPGKTKTFEIKAVEPPLPSTVVDIFDMGEKGYRIRLGNLKPTIDLEGKKLKIGTNVKGMEQILVPFRVIRQKKTSAL